MVCVAKLWLVWCLIKGVERSRGKIGNLVDKANEITIAGCWPGNFDCKIEKDFFCFFQS